jgi:hypothetical protein
MEDVERSGGHPGRFGDIRLLDHSSVATRYLPAPLCPFRHSIQLEQENCCSDRWKPGVSANTMESAITALSVAAEHSNFLS